MVTSTVRSAQGPDTHVEAEASKADWRADRSQELSDLLRSRILDAARDSLTSTDYGKLRMEMIARQAGCSRATLYRVFASKGEILLTLAIENYLRIIERVETEIDGIEDPREKYAEGLARAMALSQEDDTFSILSMDMINLAMANDPEALIGAVEKSLRPYLEQAEARGVLRKGVTLTDAAQWIVQSSNGLLNTGWPRVAGRTLNQEEQVNYLRRYLLFPIFDMSDPQDA